jgi:putative membrane protein
MNGFLIRWLILTCSIIITSYLMEGIVIKGFLSAFFAAAFLGILNAFFRPILFILTLPITIVTLGLFTFVLNAIMLLMVSGIVSGFEVRGFGSAVFGSLLISLVSWFLTSFISERGKIQLIDLNKVGKDRWE